MPVRIVFLDDEPLICECFVEQFSEQGIDIEAFTQADEAMAAINARHPDLIFLDYRMPGVRGDLLAKQMPSDIPKYLITGELEAKPEYPFIEILPKPFDNVRMNEIIQVCKNKKAE